MFATEARAPPVVHDHIAQQVFTDEPPEGPAGVRELLRYVVNLVVSVCYNTLGSMLNLLLSFVRQDDRRCTYGSNCSFIRNKPGVFGLRPTDLMIRDEVNAETCKP